MQTFDDLVHASTMEVSERLKDYKRNDLMMKDHLKTFNLRTNASKLDQAKSLSYQMIKCKYLTKS